MRKLLVVILVYMLVLTNVQPAYAMNKGMTAPVETLGEEGEQEELMHLLFAKLIYDYLDGYEGKTVEEYVNDNPDLYSKEIWENSEVTYTGLYNLVIGDWEIYKIKNNNKTTGFYGVAFKNENKVVIAFRGSEMFTEEFALDESNDWTGTDFKFALFNELSEQFNDADDFYNLVVYSLAEEGIKDDRAEITLTGHSLGGALSAYESLICGKYSYSFDGACGHVIDLTYFYGYLDIDDFTGVDDIDNIAFCNYTDDVGYTVADLIQHTNAESMYQIDRTTYLEGLNEYTLIPQTADAGSHIIWSTLKYDEGVVSLTDKVNANDLGYTYMPEGPVYLDITKNVLEEGMEYLNFDTPWSIIDYSNIDYEELAGSLTGIIKNGRVVLASVNGGVLTGYDGVGVSSTFDVDTVMYGGKGDDLLVGYVSDDVLIGGAGDNTLDGNLGNDTYIIDLIPDSKTTIRDIGGEKLTIILRDSTVNDVKRLKIDETGKISLDDNQYVYLDIATKPENVEFCTYTADNLKSIGTLDEVDAKVVNSIYKESFAGGFSNKSKNIVFLEGVGILEVYDENDNIVASVNNIGDIIGNTSTDATEEYVTATDYEFGTAYVNTTSSYPSIYLILDSSYDVKVYTDDKCNLATGVVSEHDLFEGCDRKYTRRFRGYDINFDLVSAYGGAQGEVNWFDAINAGVNMLNDLLGN